MKGHGFLVAILLKNGEVIADDFGFDNEESVDLTHKRNLFKDAKTIDDIQKGIENGFVPTYDEDSSLVELLEDLGDIDEYEEFLSKIQELPIRNIDAVLLIADEEGYGERTYSWAKYRLNPYVATSGIEKAPYSQHENTYIPDIYDFVATEFSK